MKQFLRTGKKALSVFMAVLMAMTALVLVAPESAKTFAEDEEPCVHRAFFDWYYTENPDEAGSFIKQRKCMYCDLIQTEKAADGTTNNVYYTVTYKNDWVTDTYEDIKNDNLAKTYKTEQVAFEYVLSGSAAAYKGIPTREKDFAYGKYNFTGWDVDTGSLNAVTTNIIASAAFEGEKVTHYISFFDADGKRLTIEQTASHGGAVQKPNDPDLGNVNFQRRFFTGWDYDYSHIYKDGGIHPEYFFIPNQYHLIYCDWDGTELAWEDFYIGDPATNNPTNPVRSNTNEYIYSFSGDWYSEEEMAKLENGEKATPINLDRLTLPFEYSEKPEGTEYKVYAKYDQRLKRYPLDLKVTYSDGYPAANCAIQIQGADGALLTTGYTDNNGKAHLELIYSTEYTISVTDNLGSAKQEKFTIAVTTGPYNMVLGDARGLHEGEADRCTCICHSPLSGIHIWFLNLLYSIFKIKYVCCYDMYATHGGELKYTK